MGKFLGRLAFVAGLFVSLGATTDLVTDPGACWDGSYRVGGTCPPQITSPAYSSVGETHVTCGYTTDRGDGFVDICVNASAVPPTCNPITGFESCPSGQVAVDNPGSPGSQGRQVTGLPSGSTLYCHYCGVNPSGWPSLAQTSASFTTQSGTPSATPYDLSPFSIGFAVTWPTDPTTSQTINVVPGSISSLQAAVATDNALVVVPAGVYVGNLTTWGTDVEVVFDDEAILDGYVEIVGESRVKWTGGRIVNNSGQYAVLLFQASDVLFDDAYISSSPGGAGGNEAISLRQGVQRFAVINSSIILDSANGWGIHTIASDTTTYSWQDYIFANVYFEHNGTGAGFRLNPVTRLLVVDSYFYAPSGASLRMSAATNVHVENVQGIGPMHNDFSQAGWPTFDITNGEFINVDLYKANPLFSGSTNAIITNATVSNSTVHSTGSTSLILTPFLNGGGNSAVSWDGVTVPDPEQWRNTTLSKAGGLGAVDQVYYDISGYNIPFETNWPRPPRVFDVVQVSTIAEFQAAVQASNTLVVVEPGSYSGTLSGIADDVHILMDDYATLFLGGGAIAFNDVDRFKWEGGVIDGDEDIDSNTSNLTLNDGNSDVLFDRVYFRDMGDALIILGDSQRIAMVKSTCRAYDYCFFTYPGGDTVQPGQSIHEDTLLAGNDLFGGIINGNEATTRFMNVRQHLFIENRVRNLAKHLHRIHFASQEAFVAGNQFEPTTSVVMWDEFTAPSGAGSEDHGLIGDLYFEDNDIYFPDGTGFVAEIQLGGIATTFDSPVYVRNNTGHYSDAGQSTFTISGAAAGFATTGGNSRITESFAPPSFAGGAAHAYAPYDFADDLIHYEFVWPIPPETSQTINVAVGDFSALQAAVSTSGARVNVPAGVYAGNLAINAGDVDIVCEVGARIIGTFTLGSVGTTNAQRIRVTGCDFVGTRPVFEWFRDVLFDNVYILNDVQGVSTNIVIFNGGTTVDTRGAHRFAALGSTWQSIDGASADSFPIFFQGQVGIEWFDFTFANNSFIGPNGGVQTTRFQRMRRLAFIESVMNPPNSTGTFNTTGHRITQLSEDVYMRDDHVVANFLMNFDAPEANCIDCVFKNVTRYSTVGPRFASQIQGSTALNTGTVEDSYVYSTSGTPGTEAAVDNLTSLGNNLVQAWDGSTVPQADSRGVVPVFSDYGAVRQTYDLGEIPARFQSVEFADLPQVGFFEAVTNQSELNAALASNNVYIYVAPGAYTDIAISSGNDKDIVIDEGATFSGGITITGGTRIRITGGDFNGGVYTAVLQTANVSHVTLDGVDLANGLHLSAFPTVADIPNHVTVVNSTIAGPGNGYGILSGAVSHLIVANNNISNDDGTVAGFRATSIQNAIIADNRIFTSGNRIVRVHADDGDADLILFARNQLESDSNHNIWLGPSIGASHSNSITRVEFRDNTYYAVSAGISGAVMQTDSSTAGGIDDVIVDGNTFYSPDSAPATNNPPSNYTETNNTFPAYEAPPAWSFN